MQGVKQVKKSEFHPKYYIFIKPPSMEELERRLKGRKTETEESIQRRLSIGTINASSSGQNSNCHYLS